jgi:hypothetical protein
MLLMLRMPRRLAVCGPTTLSRIIGFALTPARLASVLGSCMAPLTNKIRVWAGLEGLQSCRPFQKCYESYAPMKVLLLLSRQSATSPIQSSPY